MPNKPIINLGIAPDTGTGDSARRGGEKINNLFVDTYTLMGDNAIVLNNTDPNYGLRSTFAENSFMVGELHPAGRWQRVVGKDGTAPVRSDGSNPNLFYASRGEQLNINLADITNTTTSTSRGGTLATPVENGRFQIVLPLARAGDIVRIRDIDGTWGVSGSNRARGIDVWTTPLNYQGDSDVWNQDRPAANHTFINNGATNTSYSRFAVSADNGNRQVSEITTGLSFTTQYANLEFVYTGHSTGWLVTSGTLNQATSNNASITFNDDSDWRATNDSDPTYTFVYKKSMHGKETPIVQVGEAKYDSDGTTILAYSSLITSVDVAITDYTIDTTDGGSDITITVDDIIITVDDNSRFEGRVVAIQGV